MPAISESLLFWITLSLHVVGLGSVLCARLAERTRARGAFQLLFVSCFFVVGLFTLIAIAHDSAYWVSCGPTLSLMVVGATIDLRASQGRAVF